MKLTTTATVIATALAIFTDPTQARIGGFNGAAAQAAAMVISGFNGGQLNGPSSGPARVNIVNGPAPIVRVVRDEDDLLGVNGKHYYRDGDDLLGGFRNPAKKECSQTMAKVCPGLKGKGAKCFDCLHEHTRFLKPLCKGTGSGKAYCSVSEDNLLGFGQNPMSTQDDLARGKCSAKALNVWFSKELALARKYNFKFSDDYLTCTKKIFKPFFYQHCSTCGGDKKCIAKSSGQYFAKMMQNKKKLVDFALSVFENADCSAAIVPMAVKVVRLQQKLGRAPTQVEMVRLLYPEANLAAFGADLKQWTMMKGKPALRDEDDDIGALPAILMSPAAFKIAAIGQKIGPFIGPMKSAIMSNIRL